MRGPTKWKRPKVGTRTADCGIVMPTSLMTVRRAGGCVVLMRGFAMKEVVNFNPFMVLESFSP